MDPFRSSWPTDSNQLVDLLLNAGLINMLGSIAAYRPSAKYRY